MMVSKIVYLSSYLSLISIDSVFQAMGLAVPKQSVLPMHPAGEEEELALDYLPRGVPSMLHLQRLLPIYPRSRTTSRQSQLLPRMMVSHPRQVRSLISVNLIPILFRTRTKMRSLPLRMSKSLSPLLLAGVKWKTILQLELPRALL